PGRRVGGGILGTGAGAGAHGRGRRAGLAGRHGTMGEVRGEGRLLGIEVVQARAARTPFGDDIAFGNRVAAAARRRGLLLRASPWFVAVGPPLTTTVAEMDDLVGILDAALDEAEASVGMVAVGTA